MTSFIPAILDHFAGTAAEEPAAAPGKVSDPQLNSPVGWAIAALRWSPKPSIPSVLAGLLVGARLGAKSPPRKILS
jgi:protease I